MNATSRQTKILWELEDQLIFQNVQLVLIMIFNFI